MKKRILSIALALIMVLALLPSAALAADADEVDYSPYVRLIRILSHDEATDVMYGTFVDFDDDGSAELVLTYPTRGRSMLQVWTLKTYEDGTKGYDELFWSYYEYSDYNMSDDWAAVIENKDGELGLLVHSETVFTSSDPEYEGLINPESLDKVFYFRDGKFVSDARLKSNVWQTVPDKNGNSYYYPDESYFELDYNRISAEEYDAWIDRFTDSTTVHAYVSPTERLDTLTALEILYLLQTGFIDVPTDQYYVEPVVWAAENGITNGTGNLQFSPDNPCTRGQVVTFLWRASGSPEPKSASNPFVDVKADDYFYKAVLWAVEQGITNGMDLTHFGPDVPCTRAHVVTFLWRSHDKPAAGTSNPFSDVHANEYYTDAVLWAVKNEITNGMDATHFGPDNTCTRGQIVTFLYRDLAE